MAIKLNLQSKHFTKQLGRRGALLQIVAADTLNQTADSMRSNYNRRLKTKTKVRTKFTTNASRVFKSNPIRKSGEPRQLSKINSKLVVRNMKGGKDHYLKKLETGTTQKGNKLTAGKVPVPLNSARISGNYGRSIQKGNRIITGKTQTLSLRSRKIGISGDGFSSNRKRWGALYSGIRTGNITGDPKKPFFMIDNKNKLGIFKMKGKKIRKIRKLEKASVRHKAEPHFKNAVNNFKPLDIQKRFVKNARRMIRS